jgi:hypothetical protein
MYQRTHNLIQRASHGSISGRQNTLWDGFAVNIRLRQLRASLLAYGL